MNKLITRSSPFIIGAILALPLLAGAQWTSAPANPPSNNAAAPINVSGNTQTKTGNLTVSGLAADSLFVQGGGNAYITGNLGVGTSPSSYRLDVAGTVKASSGVFSGDVYASAFYYSSDELLKTNITRLPDALSKIMALNGVSFNWKDSGKAAIGVIAQNVEQVYPELVITNPVTGYKSVQEANLVGPLIEAVKAQQKQIEALQAEVAALKLK
jgi:endosialidase-like protein